MITLTPFKTLVLTCICFLSVQASAQFALAVSPPRFELQAKPGERLREVIEMSNSEPRAGEYTVKTADWIFEADASVTLVDDLMLGSCRPWAAIERRDVSVGPNQTHRYRFEVNVPQGTPAMQCRFAISIQGKEQTVRNAGLPIPVSARMAVIVYVTVGNAAPKLEVVGTHITTINGVATPILKVRNTGNAHGRLEGVLSGVDAGQTELEFTPASTPILAGETRDIALGASRYGAPDKPIAPRLPVSISGKLEWGKDKIMPIQERFTP